MPKTKTVFPRETQRQLHNLYPIIDMQTRKMEKQLQNLYAVKDM